jgi:hypothetical protein
MFRKRLCNSAALKSMATAEPAGSNSFLLSRVCDAVSIFMVMRSFFSFWSFPFGVLLLLSKRLLGWRSEPSLRFNPPNEHPFLPDARKMNMG